MTDKRDNPNRVERDAFEREVGTDLDEETPDKPKGMHWRTYERWRRVHDAAEDRSNIGLMGFVERLGRRTSRRA